MIQKILPLFLGTPAVLTAFYPLAQSYGLTGDVVVSRYNWDPSQGRQPRVAQVHEREYHLIAANKPRNDGWLSTIRVWNDNGTMQNQGVSRYEYDTSDGAYASFTHKEIWNAT